MDSTEYYVPDLEDIRVGYEYEYYVGSKWHKGKVPNLYTDSDGNGVHELESYLEEGNLRTPYLTKEQIVGEGLVDIDFPTNSFTKQIQIENQTIHLYYYNLELRVYGKYGIIFRGECKSINEFRTIMKWLKIK